MKKIIASLLLCHGLLFAQNLNEISFEKYLKNFDYQARKDMKISTEEMLRLVAEQ